MRVLLYYKYIDVPNPDEEVKRHRALCQALHLKGRILISTEGLNGTCSGTEESIAAYKKYLNEHPLFNGIAFKESVSEDHVFAKLFVRLRLEIVTLRQEVSAKEAAPYITADELHAALEHGDELVLIDMRNDYEAEIGRFRNAVTLSMENFRDLPKFLNQLEPYRNAKVVTYCTGGIRCERASALLKKHGFTDVRQLKGGIVTYCERYPDGYFDGACFVFDKRMSVRFPGKKPARFVSQCSACKAPCDRSLDCSDRGCHELFVCCEGCEKRNAGLCNEHMEKKALKCVSSSSPAPFRTYSNTALIIEFHS